MGRFLSVCYLEMHDRMINHVPDQERKVRGGGERERGEREGGRGGGGEKRRGRERDYSCTLPRVDTSPVSC